MLIKVEAENFLSWENLSYDVEKGVGLIDGLNQDDGSSEGSGKSSIPNAISWIGYGKIPKNVNIDDVIRIGQKGCWGQLTFDDGFKIVRTRKPNDLYYITKESEDPQRESTATLTQREITNRLGISFEAFCQTNYQSQSKQSQFLQVPQEDKMKTLAEIVELSIFDHARKEAVERLKDETSKRDGKCYEYELLQSKKQVVEQNISLESEKKQRVVDKKQFDLELLKTKFQLTEKLIENASQEHKEKLVLHDNLISDMKLDLVTAHDVTKNYKTKEKEMFQEAKDFASKLIPQQKLSLLEQRLTSLKVELVGIVQMKTYHVQQKAVAQRHAAQYKVDGLKQNEIQSFIDNPTKECPTCGTSLKNCDITHAKVELETLVTERKKAFEVMKAISVELKKPVPQVTELENKIEQIIKIINEAKNKHIKYQAFDSKLIALKERIEFQIKEELRVQTKIELQKKNVLPTLDENLKPLVAQKIIEENTITEHENKSLEWSEKESKALKIKLNNLKLVDGVLKVEISNLNEYLNALEELKIGFKEIKAYIFEGLLQELNAKVNLYLEKLFTVDVSLKFLREGKDIKTDIIINGVPLKQGLLSGGQHKRVSLAVDLSLNDLITARRGSKWGIIILDEYFTALSEESLLICLDLLQEITQPIILIEHNSILKASIDRTFNVLLEDGVTRTVESLNS